MSADSADSGFTITPYRDGPYLIRGRFQIVDQDGNDIPVQRRTVALCRCGRSRIRPFCDGTHRLVDFRAPSSAEGEPREGAGVRSVPAEADAREPGAAWTGAGS
jgi:CDGSH-type Zn-finger protein